MIGFLHIREVGMTASSSLFLHVFSFTEGTVSDLVDLHHHLIDFKSIFSCNFVSFYKAGIMVHY
jgi:hypothetical protein